jgi:hypothetical protein
MHPTPSSGGMGKRGKSTLVGPLEGTSFNPCHTYGLVPSLEASEIKQKLVIISHVYNKNLN